MTQQSAGEQSAGVVAPVFVKPPEPKPKSCGCGAEIRAYYLDPMISGGRLVAGGKWVEADEVCRTCKATSDELQSSQRRGARIASLMDRAGFAPIHRHMQWSTLHGELPKALREGLFAARYHGKNLYLFGQSGVGKTHAAVSLLRSNIEQTLEPGYIKIVPELMIELRQAVARHQDDKVLDRLSGAGSLVLDDLGAEKITDYVLDRLYILIDRWARNEKKRLIITSNLSPGEIAEKTDRRLASRIVGMCRVIEVTGDDWRLTQAEAA